MVIDPWEKVEIEYGPLTYLLKKISEWRKKRKSMKSNSK